MLTKLAFTEITSEFTRLKFYQDTVCFIHQCISSTQRGTEWVLNKYFNDGTKIF